VEHASTILNSLAEDVVSTIFSYEGRFYIPYLSITFILALAICYHRTGSLHEAAREMLRRDVILHRSSINDYKVIALNFLILGTVSGVGFLGGFSLAEKVVAMLRFAFGPGPQWTAGFPDIVIYSVALFLAYDIGNFLQHFLQHKNPLLWELHKVHHSAEVMTPLTAVRVHPLASIFSSTVLALVFAIVSSGFLYVYRDINANFLALNVLFILHYTVGAYHLQHSHIWISFPPIISAVFVSPSMHMIHHSNNPKHFGSNFGFGLTVWDRLAGTLYIPDDREASGIVFGLDDAEQLQMKTAVQLYLTPLRRIFGKRPA
jgi:sterol desaturase/sphingolipid hydroxylase (fatty acid hydroxylase superfamily)